MIFTDRYVWDTGRIEWVLNTHSYRLKACFVCGKMAGTRVSEHSRWWATDSPAHDACLSEYGRLERESRRKMFTVNYLPVPDRQSKLRSISPT